MKIFKRLLASSLQENEHEMQILIGLTIEVETRAGTHTSLVPFSLIPFSLIPLPFTFPLTFPVHHHTLPIPPLPLSLTFTVRDIDSRPSIPGMHGAIAVRVDVEFRIGRRGPRKDVGIAMEGGTPDGGCGRVAEVS